MLKEIWGSLVLAVTSFTQEAFLKISHFGQQYPNYFPTGSFLMGQTWNPNTIIAHVDHSELCEYFQNPDWRSGTLA